jgi:hypothetical protein
MRARLEQIGAVFLKGYHCALTADSPETVAPALQALDQELSGFAFEGAAMGFALLDWFTPWNGERIRRFLAGAGAAHVYMVHVGVGWVWARLPLGFGRPRWRLDPLVGWLAFDGWGFHNGFFHWPKYLAAQPPPKPLKGYARRVFDQGLGRSFWFVNGGNIELIARTLEGFPAERQPDLWSGIGLAATYAGISNEEALGSLRQRAGSNWPAMAQGSAFAAKARQRAGNTTDYTDLAARVICDLSASEAARLSDTTLENLPANAAQPAYEVWRQRIQTHFQRMPQRQGICR